MHIQAHQDALTAKIRRAARKALALLMLFSFSFGIAGLLFPAACLAEASESGEAFVPYETEELEYVPDAPLQGTEGWGSMMPESPEDGWPDLQEIAARAYLVADLDSGETIMEYEADSEAYPASMTKIMTALVVLESEDYSPDKMVYFSENACAMPAPESSTAGFVPGEEAPTLDCLYAMMTRSANEVANAIADTYGPGRQAFVDKMNEKAESLGCTHTHFVDPCGFGGYDHYTTAKDLLLICQRAMKIPLFRDLVATRVFSIPATAEHPMNGWSNIINNNYLVAYSDSAFSSPWLKSIDGIKNGRTDIAGDCLTAAATTWDGRHLISILFDAQYLGSYGGHFIGSAIMSHTLLVEGAKAIGAPRKDQSASGQSRIREEEELQAPATESSTAAIATGPLYTLVMASVPEISENPDEILMSKWTLATLLFCLSIFLLISLLALYRLYEIRKKKRILNNRRWGSDQLR